MTSNDLYLIIIPANLAFVGYFVWQWRQIPKTNARISISKRKVLTAAAIVAYFAISMMQIMSFAENKTATAVRAARTTEIASIKTEVDSIDREINSGEKLTLEIAEARQARLAVVKKRLDALRR